MRLDSSNCPSARELRSPFASPYDTGKPVAASSTAGCTRPAHGFLPYLFFAYSRPRTVPGTPAARYPSVLSCVAFPVAESIYMSRDADIGARSRKSRNVVRPSASRININPPPPILPALGCVTASANPTATAASTALPPPLRTFSPIAVACFSRETTMPCLARTGCALHEVAAKRKKTRARRIHLILLCAWVDLLVCLPYFLSPPVEEH